MKKKKKISSTYLECNMWAHGSASKESGSKPKTSPQAPQFNPNAESV